MEWEGWGWKDKDGRMAGLGQERAGGAGNAGPGVPRWLGATSGCR